VKKAFKMILAVDIGTTSMKMGVFRIVDGTLELVRQFSQEYKANIYNDGLFGDIEPAKWDNAFVSGCRRLGDIIGEIDAISISGTTPGLTAMDKNGNALYPAILMLDQRSNAQAQRIIDTIGADTLLKYTANMPVAGGCSLCSILWLKDNMPDVFRNTYMFGHSNTYFASRLTGNFAIDPSSASLSALYNTAANDLTWNDDIAKTFGISMNQLPKLIHTYDSVGTVKPKLAKELGLKKEPNVIIGGNDATLAAYSVGVKEPGEIINVNGTCEITLVCLGKCISSPNYNVRAHVIPDRWLTLHVLNAGGIALDWFKTVFCSEMSADEFFKKFIPDSIEQWLERDSTVTYVPYLMGSRYSREPLKAEFLGLTRQTTRGEIMAALIRGLCEYQKAHLKEVAGHLKLQNKIYITGGAADAATIKAKRKWMWDADYIEQEQSSMKGAAMLAQKFLEGR
jgi:sugar (pentulose or hexulose) kinase